MKKVHILCLFCFTAVRYIFDRNINLPADRIEGQQADMDVVDIVCEVYYYDLHDSLTLNRLDASVKSEYRAEKIHQLIRWSTGNIDQITIFYQEQIICRFLFFKY